MYLKRKSEEKLRDMIENYQLPIYVQGSRQVGKTTLIKHVLKDYKHIELNLYENSDYSNIFNKRDLSIDSIVKEIQILTGVTPSEDYILFIDEIQVSPAAFSTLKTFNERANFKVIVSGSNVGPVIENYNERLFPVGQFKTLNITPFSFEEFLIATGNENRSNALLDALSSKEINDNLHNKLSELFFEYLNMGGMPIVVKEYVVNGLTNNIEDLKKDLIQGYIYDFSKYSKDKDVKYLRTIYNNISTFLAQENQSFNASKIGTRSDLIADSISWISLSRMMILCKQIKDVNVPLRGSKTKKFKIFMNDTGLLLTHANYDIYNLKKENDKIFLGSIMENYMATTLIRYFDELYYYQDKSLEIDFLIQYNNNVIPIEIKSGTNKQAKSLNSFINKYNSKTALKITKENLKINEKYTNLPFYALEYILEYKIDNYLK